MILNFFFFRNEENDFFRNMSRSFCFLYSSTFHFGKEGLMRES